MPPPQTEIEKLIEALPSLGLYCVPALCLLVLLDKGKLPLLRFRRGPRETPLFSGADVFVVFVVWFVVHLSASVLMSLAHTAGRIEESEAAIVGASLTALVTCAFLVHVVRHVAGLPLRSVGLTPTYWGNALPAVALCFLVLFPLNLIQSVWILALHWVCGYEPRLQDMVTLFQGYVLEGNIRAIVFVVLSAVVVAPVVEEALFRGLLFGWLRERGGFWGGAIVSSFFFAGVHWTLSAFLPLLALGVTLSYVYHRTESLYPAMLFHAVFNGTTLALILLGS